MSRLAFFVFLVLGACALKVPVLILNPSEMGDGGKMMRDFYRSYWTPPYSDRDLIRIGLLTGKPFVRFRTLKSMKIRAYSESGAWDVASPEKVTWRASVEKIVRPPVVAHFAVTKNVIVRAHESRSIADVVLWKNRGFPSSRWVGPPPMDTTLSPLMLQRWLISLTPPTSRTAANQACLRARRDWKASCQVVARIELPPLIRGVLSAENGTFSKSFDGFLELLSDEDPVEVLDLVPEERTNEQTAEPYGARLFVIPDLRGLLNLVQLTQFANYLEGVVPSEIFPRAPEAALKAQTVVARTYAARYAKNEDSDKPFQICASTYCQVYRGVQLKKNSTSAAVADTADLVLWETPNELAETFYHGICGGHTEPKELVLSAGAKPYLKGVIDQNSGTLFTPLVSDAAVSNYLNQPAVSYCGISSFTKQNRWRWTETLDRSKLDTVARELTLESPIKEIRIARRGVSGRALELEVKSEKGSKRVFGELKIRMLLGGLLSSIFVLEPKRNGRFIEELTITGGGYGHGVGLCQLGAIGRAESGQNFAEILAAYYPGTMLAPLNGPVVP